MSHKLERPRYIKYLWHERYRRSRKTAFRRAPGHRWDPGTHTCKTLTKCINSNAVTAKKYPLPRPSQLSPSPWLLHLLLHLLPPPAAAPAAPNANRAIVTISCTVLPRIRINSRTSLSPPAHMQLGFVALRHVHANWSARGTADTCGTRNTLGRPRRTVPRRALGQEWSLGTHTCKT